MFWDTHMHCHFSGDSEAASEDMVRSAIENDLDGICFTDHLDFDYKEEPGLFLLDIDAYQKEISALQKKYAHRLPILWGIEIGLQPHVAGENRAVTQKYPFDFVIGSSHCVDCIDIYYPEFYENTTEEAAYRRYFEAILKNVHSDADYDVYGHLDYVVRYGPNKNKFYTYENYADIIDEILRALIEKGKGIELNTAGFKYGLGHPNPTEDIIRRYRALGGEIITIGADGHKPEHVAYDFHKVAGILREAGFSYYTVFRQRKPVFYPVP
jgi:histidinol-phosphatase (PHP family)